MKKYYLLLIASFCVISLVAQQRLTFHTHYAFQDDNQKIFRINSEGTEIGDLIEIQEGDGVKVFSLDTDFELSPDVKYSLVAFFTKLSIAKAQGILALDITYLKDLKEFVSYDLSFLIDFHVGDLTKLEKLKIGNTDLDILALGGLKNLKELAIGKARLTELDVSQLKNLEILSFSENPLKKIDVSELEALKDLTLAYNELTKLDVKGLAQLERLNCSYNPLSSLDITGTADNLIINCSNSKLLDIIGFKPTHSFFTPYAAAKQAVFVEMVADGSGGFKSKNQYSLELEDKLTLEEGAGLSFEGGYFKAAEAGLGVAAFSTKLAEGKELSGEISFGTDVEEQSFSFTAANAGNLKFWGSQVVGDKIKIRKKDSGDSYVEYNIDAEISIDNNTEYEVKGSFLKLNWAGVNFKNIELGELKWLKQLSCGMNNEFEELDLTQLSALEELYCTYNSLKTLKLPETSKLKILDCNSNKELSSIENLNNAVELVRLSCEQTKIDFLDISALKNLEYLNFSESKVESLTMPTSTTGSALEELICSKNALTALDLSAAINLESLECNNNKIAKLNISGLTKLMNLNCSDNALRALDLSDLASDASVNCSHNQLLDVVPSKNLIEFFHASNQLVTVHMKADGDGYKSEEEYNFAINGLDFIITGDEFEYENNYFKSTITNRETEFKRAKAENNYSFSGKIKFITMGSFSFISEGERFKLGILSSSSLESFTVSPSMYDISAGKYVNVILADKEYKITAGKQYTVTGAFSELYCSKNKLTALDLSKLTSLKELYCEDNQLSTLDVSGLTQLNTLQCQSNQLLFVKGIEDTKIKNSPDENFDGSDQQPRVAMQLVEVGKYRSVEKYEPPTDNDFELFTTAHGLKFKEGYFWSDEKITAEPEFKTTFNAYGAKALSGEITFLSATATIRGKKILKGKTLVADQFEFELIDPGFGAIASAKNDAAGNFTIAYQQEIPKGSTYIYHLKEKNTGIEGIEYDETWYYVEIVGPASATESAVVTIKDSYGHAGGFVVDVPEFTNTYSGPSTGVELVKKENKINYYPNPVRDKLQIESEDIITELSVFDISGKLLIREKVDNTQVRISTEELNPGMYILRVITAQGTKNFKIIKQ